LHMPFVIDNPWIKISVASLIISSLLVLCAREIWRGTAEKLPSRKPVAVVFIFLATFFAARTLVAPFVALSSAGLPADPAMVAALTGTVLTCSVVMTVLFVSLTMERLESGQRSLALTDPLTGLSNRRSLDQMFGSGTLEPKTSIIVFDLDHFKNINDQFGHAIGDEVICEFAKICRENFRQVDLTVRLGGEEFAVILRDTDIAQAARIAERVRKAFALKIIDHGGVAVACTVSGGVACSPSNSAVNLTGLLVLADQALYRAKRAGRNRVFLPISKRAA
jgi:diguanylate cyclase (GGDEF)-like protein